jgi:type II secretory pathway component PulC
VQPLDAGPDINTAQLFSQAQILPKYENGAMVGVQVSAIQAGSVLAGYGLQDGDVITGREGQRLATPEDAADLLTRLGGKETFTVTVVDTNGAAREVSIDPNLLREPAQPGQE